MTLELNEYAVETLEEFTVAGVAQRGTDVDATELWEALDDFADDLREVATSDERYGVVFEVEEGGEEFTYLVGHAVESTDGLPPETAAVEIPEGSYAVFRLRDVDVDELVDEINEELLSDFEHERREGPLFQRYDLAETPVDPGESFDLFVPIEDE